MTAIFICQLILIIAVVGIIFIFLRNFPLLVEFEPKPISNKKKLSYRIKNNWSNFQKGVGTRFNYWREKNLRKIRIWILRTDNSLNAQLDKIRKKRIHFHITEKQKKEKNYQDNKKKNYKERKKTKK